MNTELLSLIMDGFILFFLALTAFFAVRLSVNLKTFRDSRKDFEKLISDLTRNIARADSSIKGLQQAAKQSGEDLEHLIREARSLRDELQIITESGESMAGRLEKVSEQRNRYKARQARTVLDGIKSEQRAGRQERRVHEETPRSVPEKSASVSEKDPPMPSFFSIRDPEFDGSDVIDDDVRSVSPRREERDNTQEMSKAEQDLYAALNNIRNRRTKVGTR